MQPDDPHTSQGSHGPTAVSPWGCHPGLSPSYYRREQAPASTGTPRSQPQMAPFGCRVGKEEDSAGEGSVLSLFSNHLSNSLILESTFLLKFRKNLFWSYASKSSGNCDGSLCWKPRTKLHADSPFLLFICMIWANFSAVIYTTHHLETSQKRPAGEGWERERMHPTFWRGLRSRQTLFPDCHGQLSNSLRRSPEISTKCWQQMVKGKCPSFLRGRTLLLHQIAVWAKVWGQGRREWYFVHPEFLFLALIFIFKIYCIRKCKCISVSERSQSGKSAYHTSPALWHSGKGKIREAVKRSAKSQNKSGRDK